MQKKWVCALLATLVVSLWGLTFVSLRVALDNFTPSQVMLLRCVIAYISLVIIYPKFHPSEGLKQELLYLVAGACGTTFYIVLANYALLNTMASNVSVLSSTSPIFVALLAPFFFSDERFSKRIFLGLLIAMAGTVFVVTNGNFNVKLSPLGDFLALASAACWAFYSLVLRKIKTPYKQLYVTRRIFLYGILVVIPFCIFEGSPMNFAALQEPMVVLNLLFLGLVAYTFCHTVWALVIKGMGAVWSSRFTYLTPIVTIIASAFILDEKIGLYTVLGTALILGGVMVSDKNMFQKKPAAESLKAAENNLSRSGISGS
jgi:drug/metabolite transporter (DMT)-like permease